MSGSTFAERMKQELSTNTKCRTQKEWAKIFGVKQSTVSDYVTGKKMPSSKKMADIALALGVSVEWLQTGRGSKHPGDSDTITPELARLIENWNKMPDESKGLLLGTAEAMVRGIESIDSEKKAS